MLQLVTVRDVADSMFTYDATSNSVMIDPLSSDGDVTVALLGFSYQDMAIIKVQCCS